MRIYTSYYANLKNIDKDIVPISIAGKAPDWYNGLEFKTLAPRYEFFMEWKKNKDNNFYIRHFDNEVLDLLDVDDIIWKLHRLSGNKDVVLLCYEKPGDFCHRHLVAEWFCKNGYYVDEYNANINRALVFDM